jgi:hypothetical protein
MRIAGFDKPVCILPFDTAVLSRRACSGGGARLAAERGSVQDIERRHREFADIFEGKK